MAKQPAILTAGDAGRHKRSDGKHPGNGKIHTACQNRRHLSHSRQSKKRGCNTKHPDIVDIGIARSHDGYCRKKRNGNQKGHNYGKILFKKHFHIHDGKENPPKNHLSLGDSEIDLMERLEMAEKCNARCVLETKTIEALRKSVQWIKCRK